MEYRERVLALIHLRGPTQPLVIAKELMTNSTIAGAMLSEMTDKGLLKASYIKVGSGPLYYIPGQQDQLLRYTYALNEKDRKTVELLQQKKILRENTQDPLTRVGLKTIKDFAIPLEVQHNNTQEIFWKWFSLSDADAEQLIKQELGIQQTPIQTQKERKRKENQPQNYSINQTATNQTILTSQTMTAPDLNPELIKESVIQETINKESVINTPQILRKPIPPSISSSQPMTPQTSSPAQITLPAEQQLPVNDEFLISLQTYFQINHIPITHATIIKKNKEYEFIISLPSALGQLLYYCYSVNKKKITEADLSHAFVKSQLRKLPCLFLSPGELTKPAIVYSKQLQSITFKTLPSAYQNTSVQLNPASGV